MMILSAAALLTLSPAVLAQTPVALTQPQSTQPSNIAPSDTRSDIAPALPSPNLPENDRPSTFLRAAQGALAAGRGGEAQESLEMAQTRLLDRSTPLFQTRNPSDNPTVGQISQAMQALANNDRAGCMRLIQAAIGSATAQGL
jgi:hypothetical protein